MPILVHFAQTTAQAASEYTGEAALLIIIVDRVIIPLAKKYFPIKKKMVESEEIRKNKEVDGEENRKNKELEMDLEARRVELEIKRGTLENLQKISEGYTQQTEILRGLVTDVKEIKGDMVEIKNAIKPPRRKKASP